MRITNYELRVAKWKSLVRFLLLFCALFILISNSFGQNQLDLQARNDWTVRANYFSQIITGGTTEQKRDALLQIRNFRTEAASRIAILALKDSSEIVRATAAASIVFLPTIEAAQNLVPLLADKNSFVRREAANALGKVGDPNTIEALLTIFQKDKIAEVRNAAIIALGAIGNAAAVPELTKILQRNSQNKEEFLRRSAARSIGQIAQIIQTGRIKVVTPESFTLKKSDATTKQIYPKLVESFPAFHGAIDVLIQTLQNSRESQDVKRETAFALGAIGDESAISVLQSNMQNEDYYLAQICKEALQNISRSTE